MPLIIAMLILLTCVKFASPLWLLPRTLIKQNCACGMHNLLGTRSPALLITSMNVMLIYLLSQSLGLWKLTQRLNLNALRTDTGCFRPLDRTEKEEA